MTGMKNISFVVVCIILSALMGMVQAADSAASQLASRCGDLEYLGPVEDSIGKVRGVVCVRYISKDRRLFDVLRLMSPDGTQKAPLYTVERGLLINGRGEVNNEFPMPGPGPWGYSIRPFVGIGGPAGIELNCCHERPDTEPFSIEWSPEREAFFLVANGP